MSKIKPSMKTITLPDHLFEEAEAAAKDLGISRAKLIQTALEEFLKSVREKAIKDRMDRYVAEQGGLSEEDQVLLDHAEEMVRKVEWNE